MKKVNIPVFFLIYTHIYRYSKNEGFFWYVFIVLCWGEFCTNRRVELGDDFNFRCCFACCRYSGSGSLVMEMSSVVDNRRVERVSVGGAWPQSSRRYSS